MFSAQLVNSKDLKENQSEMENTAGEEQKKRAKDQMKENQKEHLKNHHSKEHQKDHSKEHQRDHSKEHAKDKENQHRNSIHHENDVKSIGNYTGLESLENSKGSDNKSQVNKEPLSTTNCTCACDCDLCVSVRAYHDAKRLGILDYNLTNSSYMCYLNHLSSLHHFHDLKDHNLDTNLELENFEDLVRLLPDSKIMIAIVTFNMNGKHCSNLHELLLPDQLDYFPDIYVVGVQEFMRDSEEIREWTIELQSHIGPTHVLLHDSAFGVLHLSVFIRRDLIWHVSVPEDDSLLCRLNPPTNLIRTKGAVAISLKIFGTSFLFVNNHLPAHQSKIQERIDEYNRMSTGLDLPRNLKSSLKRSYQSHDITNRFDCSFWFGDLNFRVDQDQETVLDKIEVALEKCEKDVNNKHCFDSIFKHDQLSLSMSKGEVLTGFEEAPVNFQPTYKYLINSNEYDEESTRIPSYTDRIVFKNKRAGHITCKLYTAIQSCKSSDHKPVFGLYHCLIRPGVDDCPSNAGFFNHDIYVEGLKRLNIRKQAMKNDHPERPRGLIANLKARKWFHSSLN